MDQKTRFCPARILLAILCCCLLCGCGGGKDSARPPRADAPAPGTPGQGDGAAVQDDRPLRDSTPHVLVPAADGALTYGVDAAAIDASHTDQGYVMVQYLGDKQDAKLQIATPDGNTYTYTLSQGREYEAFPLPSGSGTYALTVLENVEAKMYATVLAQDVAAEVADEFLPFLYPNQYVSFTPASQVVEKGKELVSGVHSDLEAVEAIYHYIVQNITYDSEKAQKVIAGQLSGYLPDVDDVLQAGKGICFDYAALMASMLRSQNIPTRLEVGYADEAYHAWISTYIKDVGWIDGIIEFDGASWSLMDPTFAVNKGDSSLKDYIGSGNHYTVRYTY